MERSLAGDLLVLFGAAVALGASAQGIYDDDLGYDDGTVNGGNTGGDGVPGNGAEGPSAADATAFSATLHGFQEVPAISTSAGGFFSAELDEASSMIVYTLSYADLEAPVQQAHIQLGQTHTNGGVSAFLCTNLDNGPPDTQACPQGAAEITGAIMAEQVVGPVDQGLGAGELAELVAAIREKSAYVNVHTETFPAGEIRGQILPIPPLQE
jgi:hypothetical protein